MTMYQRHILLFFATLAVVLLIIFSRSQLGVPLVPSPSEEGKKSVSSKTKPASVYKDLIRIETPLPESEVSSPLTVRGAARGPWFFEASFPVVLVDWDGRIVAEGIAQTTGEWMTMDYVPFTAELIFTSDTSVSNRGALILQKSNPSGLPANDDAFEFTLFFAE